MESDLTSFISFFRQLGLVVASAASFWGFVFLVRSRLSKNNVSSVVFHWVAKRLLWLVHGGVLVAVLAWFILSNMLGVFAHEGITLYPTVGEYVAGLSITTPGFIAILVLSLAGLFYQFYQPSFFNSIAPAYFLVQFIILVVLASVSGAWTGDLSSQKIFFVLHGFHSVFTLGTVLVLDFLLLSSKSSQLLQRHIFPLFPTISMVIWLGLGLDFLSVAFVFSDALMLTSRFFFSQTVVSILIINGILLSGPITRKILDNLERGFQSIGRRWLTIADVAGTISVTSWGAITFVDFFQEINMSYASMITVYVCVIGVLFFGHYFWDRWDRDEPYIPQESH